MNLQYYLEINIISLIQEFQWQHFGILLRFEKNPHAYGCVSCVNNLQSFN